MDDRDEERDWPAYNERLVKRGEFFLSPDFVDTWDEEVAAMNAGKPGRPFEFPESFIEFMAVWYTFFQLPYRQLEGAARQLAEFLPLPKAADYTTLWTRIRALDLEVQLPAQTDGPVVAAVDSTGVKVTNRSEWLRRKHGTERRGWLKVHVAVDADSGELLSLEVTDETTHDSAVFEDLVADVELEDCLADGAYDTEAIFEYLMEERGLDPPGVKVRENASPGGLSPRAFAVREQQRTDWKENHDYGQRWAAETLFSGVKGRFGERVRATSPAGARQEVERQFALYSLVAAL